MHIDDFFSRWPEKFRPSLVTPAALSEAKRRVLDSLGCFYGAFAEPAVVRMRAAFAAESAGAATLWGTGRRVSAELAAWLNGSGVRALDYNDTYLSKEPCHPSDLNASFWAAAEAAGGPKQGRRLLHALLLGYDVMCRLCDGASIRARGWDHVTYLPIASAVGCAFIFGLNRSQTRHAIALALTGQIAMRQTRVGTISDWKAACASYAARAGLMGARLAAQGFTGPSDLFTGRHGFFAQVSGPFSISTAPLGRPWRLHDTHVKFFPAEHHAQSAIEAALLLRRAVAPADIAAVRIDSFDASVQIIGSEKEKWRPTTRETADHSLPFLVCVALLDGAVSAAQYQRRRYLDADVRRLMAKTSVTSDARFTRLYPKKLPARVTVQLKGGGKRVQEILLPKGYAGHPLNDAQIREKFDRLASRWTTPLQRDAIAARVRRLDTLDRLSDLGRRLAVARA
jgi:2-methylcitrate dehydratase